MATACGNTDFKPDRPPTPCWACGKRKRWLSIYDVVVCGICHPPWSPYYLKEWIDDDD